LNSSLAQSAEELGRW